MTEITALNSSDTVNVANLLCASFYDDLGTEFVFPTLSSRRRWFSTAMLAATRLAMDCGVVTGIRSDDGTRVCAAALWYTPDRPFPPPWHRTLVASLWLAPMLFEFATYVRFSRLSRLFYSLMPRERPYYYLGGVAVEPEHRNQRLGTRLIQWGLDCAEAEDCTVFVNCWDALLPYYKRLGFLPVCEGRLAEIDATCHGLLWMPGNHRSQDTADEQ